MNGEEYRNKQYENQIPNETIKNIIRDEWKICLPQPYKYLKHNNCIPCFKGGKKHFYAVAKYYPEEFQRAIEYAEKYNSQPFKDITLRQIAEQVQTGSKQLSFIDDDFGIPCMCAS